MLPITRLPITAQAPVVAAAMKRFWLDCCPVRELPYVKNLNWICARNVYEFTSNVVDPVTPSSSSSSLSMGLDEESGEDLGEGIRRLYSIISLNPLVACARRTTAPVFRPGMSGWWWSNAIVTDQASGPMMIKNFLISFGFAGLFSDWYCYYFSYNKNREFQQRNLSLIC